MKPQHRPSRILARSPLLVLLLLACVAVVAGCGLKPQPSRVQLRPVESRQIYAHTFPQAFYSKSTTGEHEIVLIDDGQIEPTAQAASWSLPSLPLVNSKARGREPLQPSQAPPLRQVVHIRVHWRPIRGTKPDHPSATNAVVDWYITAPSGSGSDDRLHYQGAAFVEVMPSGNLAKVTISNGQLALVEAVGSLHDPIGQSHLSGTCVARRDDARVAAISAPLRLDAAAASVARPARDQRPRQENGAAGGR